MTATRLTAERQSNALSMAGCGVRAQALVGCRRLEARPATARRVRMGTSGQDFDRRSNRGGRLDSFQPRGPRRATRRDSHEQQAEGSVPHSSNRVSSYRPMAGCRPNHQDSLGCRRGLSWRSRQDQRRASETILAGQSGRPRGGTRQPAPADRRREDGDHEAGQCCNRRRVLRRSQSASPRAGRVSPAVRGSGPWGRPPDKARSAPDRSASRPYPMNDW